MAKLNEYILIRGLRKAQRIETAFYLKSSLMFLLLALVLQAPAGAPHQPVGPAADSITVAASAKYKPTLMRRIFIGNNYRQVWSTPVRMPVFDLKASGLKVTELGGGQQTKSLQLVDKAGVEWVLRTVDKDVEKALPPKLRGTLAQTLVQDMISAAHPYAPLVVAHMAKAIGVSAPDPQLFYIPDDPAFGEHQKIFAGQVVFLEKRNPTPDDSDSKSTATAQEKLGEDEDRLILQRQVLKARLLDMLIADWDRHADQWRWGILDSAGAKYYYAIPRDRDQAFFQSSGLIPRVGKAVAMKHLNWFKAKTKGLPSLNYKSREFDPIFLNDLDAGEWQQVIEEFQAQLSDAVIDAAVARMPAPVVAGSGDFLRSRLKSRRNTMMRPVMEYYKQVAAEVQVWGTKKAELFTVTPENNGVRVQVFALDKAGKQGLQRYNRFFPAGETRFLHLEGLGGKDRFQIGKVPQGAPVVHVYGMDGNDLIDIAEKNDKKIKLHFESLGAAPVVAQKPAEEEEGKN
ncbi:hypothetical protein [Pseudocnuella soli]|uniref:hypothetical protein n=1 Tax=Pseudocnuella soli TaxID=2502779 RepID=UPI00104B1C78|nr:hypothetical protein [Pseudocnuella soli]